MEHDPTGINAEGPTSPWIITESNGEKVMKWPILTLAQAQAQDAKLRLALVRIGQLLASGEITEDGTPDEWDMANEDDYGENEEPLDDKDEDNK